MFCIDEKQHVVCIPQIIILGLHSLIKEEYTVCIPLALHPLCSVVSAPDIPRRRYTSLPLICEVICSEVTLKTLEIVLSSSKCQGQSCWCCMNLRRYYEMVARENPLVWPFKLFEMRNGQFYWTVGCLYTTRKFCLQFSLICENDQSLAKIAQLLHSNTPALTLDN